MDLSSLGLGGGWFWAMLIIPLLVIAGMLILRARMGLGQTHDDDLEVWRRASHNWASKRELMNSGHLVSLKQFRRDGPGNRQYLGIWGGRYVLVSGPYNSVMVIGSSDSGKSSRIFIPQLLYGRSAAVSASAKGDVLALTYAARTKLGSVTVFGLTHSDVYPGCRWSPLLDVKKFSDAEACAVILMNASKAISDAQLQNQAFWDSHGRQVIAPLCLVAVELGWPISDLSLLLLNQDLVQRTLNKIGDQSALRQWRLHLLQPAETKGNIEATVTQVLEVWSRDAVKPITDVEGTALGTDAVSSKSIWDEAPKTIAEILSATPTGNHAVDDQAVQRTMARLHEAQTEDQTSWVQRSPHQEDTMPLPAPARLPAATSQPETTGEILDLDGLLHGTGTLYMVSPASDQESFAPIFDALFSSILARLEKASVLNEGLPLDPKLQMSVDEAANVAPIRRLDREVTKCRGEGGELDTGWQARSQQDTIYGRERAQTIWDSHQVTIFMPKIKDLDTIHYVTEIVGRDVYKRDSETHSQNGGSTTTSDEWLNVAPTACVNGSPQDEAIVQIAGLKPVIVKIPAWFEDKRMRALIPPEIAARFDKAFGGKVRRHR